jgi:hypothetical protein
MSGRSVTLLLTLHISPLLMRALPDQRQLREYLQDEGLWPVGAVQERWQPDFATPGAYIASLELEVQLPPGGHPDGA